MRQSLTSTLAALTLMAETQPPQMSTSRMLAPVAVGPKVSVSAARPLNGNLSRAGAAFYTRQSQTTREAAPTGVEVIVRPGTRTTNEAWYTPGARMMVPLGCARANALSSVLSGCAASPVHEASSPVGLT